MRNNFRYLITGKSLRILAILVAIVIYVVLAIGDIRYTIALNATNRSFPLPIPVSLGTSFFIALIFLLVGTLIWLYARDRNVAFLLCAFCYTSMIPFEFETASLIYASGKSWIALLSGITSAFIIFLLAILLLVFPKNYFTSLSSKFPRPKHLSLESIRSSRNISFLQIYAACLFLLLCATTASTLFKYFNPFASIPAWLFASNALSDGISLIGSIVTVIISFQHSSKRERVQLRFFTSGIILAFAPLLVLTILPEAAGLPYIDSQITALAIILLPIAFGYSILRYQLLVFDTYIRRTVKWLLGIIFLAILVYVAIIVGNLDNSAHLLTDIVLASMLAILAPLFWWLAQLITERVLFKESLYYRRLINEPIKLADEMLSLEHAAQLITVAAIQAVETPQICLFILSEESGCYHLVPGLMEGQQDAARHDLMQRLLTSSRLLAPIPSLPDAIELHPSIEERLHMAHRPLLSYEVIRGHGETPVGLERYLTSASPDERGDLLLAPIRAQGKMIGLLVLGERGDHQSYAGPDFELVELLLARYSSLLETARLQERSRRYTRMLNDLYQVNTISADESQTLESIASVYASVAAMSLQVGVQLWICQGEPDNEQHELRPLLVSGEGPRLITTSAFSLSTHQEDWIPIFSSGRDIPESGHRSPILSQLSSESPIPFAWLPLKKKNGDYIGLLILTYGRPHQFLKDEMSLLEMFAEQYAASLENTSITLELRDAYERQKELDLLKDQFIITASHELRTPLTAVLGYLELLAQYHEMLDTATSADFIAKAQRGCNELMLMVNNIMDANQMQFTIDRTKMESIPLHEAVAYIVEMLDVTIQREQRSINITIPADLFVEGNTTRLHQVLLNLLGNAFKYSPPGTPIEIYARIENDMVRTCIRDYGAGIPREEQSRLFERFVRLERDMNSPERGTGLGLYTCKRLIQAMEGDIQVESSGQEGKGSIFSFTLYNAVAALHEDREEPQSFSFHR